MSLIPDFELGLWNAWIFMLPVMAITVFGPRILGERGCEEDLGLTKKEKTISNAGSILPLALIALSIFLPIELGTVWFFAGSLIYLLGAIIMTMAIFDFRTTGIDKPVTKGVYRFSRNPMYLGTFLFFGGTGIACLSWVFLISTGVLVVLLHIVVISEERSCLQKYGSAYQGYMNHIPRWIGIPKSGKKPP
jgi:protein-S-isoprenylcysteine O-methyltransferase Ste14